MKAKLNSILQTIHLAHQLKKEERHCWYEGGRPESVAEHVWCTSFIAILLQPYFSKKVDMEKVLKMINVHDIVEAEAGDTPFFMSHSLTEKQKATENEKRAMENLYKMLGEPTGGEIKALWYEFEERKTYEAQICFALDKLEASIQHNQSPIETWIEQDIQCIFLVKEFCKVDPILEALNEMVVAQAIAKMDAADIDWQKIKESFEK